MKALLAGPRWRLALVLAVLGAVIPPILGRTGLMGDLFALNLGIGICFAAAALSLNLLMGYAGQISLGHAALLGVGAFSSGILTGRGPELAFMWGFVIGALVGAAFAFLLGLPALRLRGLYLAVVTIAFAFMVEESLFKWRPITGGSAGIEIPRPLAGDFYFSNNPDYLALLLVLLVGFWFLDVNVTRTKLGRAFHAIREDESVAQSFAVDVTRYKLLAFVLSGALAGAAGSMYGSLVTFVNADTFRYDVSLTLVVMVVVGGLASRPGVVIAGIAFALLPRLWANLEFLRNWEQLIGAFLLMDLMSRHPGGIAGAIRHSRERKAAKEAQEAVDPDEGEQPLPKLPALPRPEGLPERPREESGAPLLKVEEVSVSFGGLQALDEAGLEVHRGKIVGLIGPNGAGKTTLFNVVSGLIRPERGRIWFEGREVTALPPHERSRLGMGRTFQHIGLAGSLSVRENMLLAQHSVASYDPVSALGFLPAVARKERELGDRATQAIEALGFERFADTPVRYLSHGQQRLVELACSLVTAPELLLLDEPSAGMAPAAAENLADRLKDLRDELGRTVLLIEHHIPLVLDVCDYIYVLNFGQVLASGTTADIASQPEVIAAYFGEQVEVGV